MPTLYSNQSSDPKSNAQRNLISRTHFVDDDTLRYHKSRVISARHTDEGLLFAIVTSDALDFENRKRGFRYTIFDVFGTVVSRCDLEHARRTSAQALKDMWDAVNALDAQDITRKAIERAERNHAQEMDTLRAKVDALWQSRT